MSVPSRRTTEYVVGFLREQIINGKLRTGERIDQDAIAAELNVSRTPVREALVRLDVEGLVEVRPYRGAVVQGMDTLWVAEFIALRIHTEGFAARLGAPVLTDADLKEMRSVLSVMAHDPDPEDFFEANRRFHAVLYDAAGAPQLTRMIDPLLQQFQRFRSHYSLGQHPAVGEQHLHILEACTLRDPDLAEDAVRAHILGVLDGIRDINVKFDSQGLRILREALRGEERVALAQFAAA